MPPDPQTGRPDFFALEAGEYLQQLGRLAGQSQAPGEAAVRAARGLRGASLLSGPVDFTRAAGAIEAVAKALRDGLVAWGPDVAEILRAAIEELERLLRSSRAWGPAESEAAQRQAADLEQFITRAGVPLGLPFGRRAADRTDPGVRAFLARESAVVAGSLERLARDPAALFLPAAIENVLRATQPLRGVAVLGEVPPLGELLEVIEQILRDLLRGHPPPPRLPEAMSVLAGALARAARDIVDGREPAAESPEVAGAAARVHEITADERDIVSIEGLFAAGDSNPIVRRGEPPTQETPGPDAALALMALGGRLSQAADQLERTTAPSLRTLQQVALRLALAGGLPPRPALPTDRMVATLVRALARGALRADPAGILAAMRQGALAMNALAGSAAETGAPSVAMVTGMLETLPGESLDAPDLAAAGPAALPADVSPEAEAWAPHPPEPVVPIESLLADDEVADLVVPIESLQYDRAPLDSAIASPAPPPRAAQPSEPSGLDSLEQSFRTYGHLLGGVAEVEPAAQAAPASRPVSSGVPGSPDAAEGIVPIATLLYRGRAALERANQVRIDIEAAVAARRGAPHLAPLLQELLELVPLAIDDAG